MTDALVGREYRILGSLGAGGMGEIFLASAHGASGFTKLVVLKTMRPELFAIERAREMFLQEARVAARLNHPNVIQVYEVTGLGRAPALVMEYLEGHALSSILSRAMARGASVPLGFGVRAVVDALRGLQYAHDLRDFDGTPLGLVHRDVSPQNIVVTYDGQVKLLDFGVAKIDATSIKTGAGERKGKLRYMSPEQLSGRPVDRRADVYAMGCVLWEVATGRWLWHGTGDADLVLAVTTGRIPPPRTVNPSAHPHLSSIVLKAMALNPAERHASSVELRNELETFLADELHNATQEALGGYVAHEFRDLRAERSKFIQTQLRATTMRSAAASLPDTALPVPSVAPGAGETPRGLPAVAPSLPPPVATAPAGTTLHAASGGRGVTLALVLLGATAATLVGILVSGLAFTKWRRTSAAHAPDAALVTRAPEPSASPSSTPPAPVATFATLPPLDPIASTVPTSAPSVSAPRTISSAAPHVAATTTHVPTRPTPTEHTATKANPANLGF